MQRKIIAENRLSGVLMRSREVAIFVIHESLRSDYTQQTTTAPYTISCGFHNKSFEIFINFYLI